MLLKELTDRSPLRVFEGSIHGGLGAGNLGVVVARHGVGKTAFLVDIALDDLMRGRRVLHVTIGRTIDHVREYYDEIFHDLAMLREVMGFVPVAIVMDGYEFAQASLEDVQALAAIAEQLKCEFWMTAHTHHTDPRDDRGIPEPVAHLAEAFAVIVHMAADGKAVHLRVLKDHDNPDVRDLALALDPTTMLLRQER